VLGFVLLLLWQRFSRQAAAAPAPTQ